LRLSVRRYLSIKVIPVASGAHAGNSGSFILMESDRYKPVAYLEGETSGLFLEEKPEIDSYRKVVKGLEDAALDEENSRELIGTVATERYASREDKDDGE
jgi:hypothetical protein